ncbi:LmeA family phospholipid-binding protein [Nocardia macrotermitis]|uniref:DUF2993 domain-containing protein n=1 Tax=Nocardia macrotermitis TaxID=2585198 RepID=A0A7K0DDN2_9NOCA|nr:DUF2993 domain-containing protein [Nocardia macrotermitis]MQY23915.1 hypothetical protein [Nocardia macrotermitis]
MRGFLIFLVVVVIALVAGDRVAVVLAQNEIGDKIAAEYGMASRPSVRIGGFPFLTQAVAGKYHAIEVHAGDWTGEKIAVHDLDVTLTDLAAPLSDVLHGNTANMVADSASATARVPYETVQGYAPSGVKSISYGTDGMHVTGTFTVEGLSVPGTVVVTVSPTANGISVTPISVQSAVGGPSLSLSLLRRTLTFVVPLQKLPLGARLTAIQPEADGLHVTAVAHNVHLSEASDK